MAPGGGGTSQILMLSPGKPSRVIRKNPPGPFPVVSSMGGSRCSAMEHAALPYGSAVEAMTQSELLELARMLRQLARTSPTPAIRCALLQIADRYAAAVVTEIGNAGLPIDQRYKRARYYRLMAALAVTPQTQVELNRLADWYAKLAGAGQPITAGTKQ